MMRSTGRCLCGEVRRAIAAPPRAAATTAEGSA